MLLLSNKYESLDRVLHRIDAVYIGDKDIELNFIKKNARFSDRDHRGITIFGDVLGNKANFSVITSQTRYNYPHIIIPVINVNSLLESIS